MKLINIGGSLNKVIIPGIAAVYFSYETLIAINDYNGSSLVAKNEWSRTTGKHLGIIKQELASYEETKHDELMIYTEGLFNK